MVMVAMGLVVGCGSRPRSEPTSSGASRPATTTSSEALPRTPSRAAVQEAILEVSPAVGSCLAGYPGRQVVVELALAPSGALTSATVLPPGPPDEGGPTSESMLDAATTACVTDAVAPFRVPPFTRESFLVRYPFRGP
jgi:hypothetical protein